MRYFQKVVLMMLLMATNAWSESLVRVPNWGIGNNDHNRYFIELLKLAFERTSEDGPVTIEFSKTSQSNPRDLMDLKLGQGIDVIWYGTSPEMEANLLPVRVSLLKELNQYRVLLIREADRAKFNQVSSLADLRKFKAGSGAGWPSTAMLKRNGLPLVVVANPNLLASMLKANRVDYMARNLSEAWDESLQYQNTGVALDSRLLLRGGADYYFFVNKVNKPLAERIERGLKLAMGDGSFDKLFESVPSFRQGEMMLRDPQRIRLSLQ